MTITTQDRVARAVFTTNPTVTTVDRGAGVSVELDADGAVVAGSFDTHGGAVRLAKLLEHQYSMTLSSDDRDALLTTRL